MQCNPRTVMSARCAGPWGGCIYIDTNRYQSKIMIEDCNFGVCATCDRRSPPFNDHLLQYIGVAPQQLFISVVKQNDSSPVLPSNLSFAREQLPLRDQTENNYLMGRQNTYGGLMTGNVTLCKGVGITPALSLSSSSANSDGLNQRGALKRLRSLVTGVELASALSHPEPVLESQIAMQIIQVNCIAGDEIDDDDFFLESWDTVGSFLQLYVGFFFILLLLVVYSVHTLFGGLIYLLYPRVTRMDLRFPYLSIKYNIMCIIPSLDVVFRLSKKSSQPLPV
eukprot:PhF_6_TR43405/c0_g2_i2/m.66657